MLVYFESQYGPLVIDRCRIVGAEQCRIPSEYPSKILLDCPPHERYVRNSLDDVQARLMAADAATIQVKE